MPNKTETAAELLEHATHAGSCPQSGTGSRGIVICAGGPVMITNAYVLLRVLRDVHKSSLPVEIWHLGAHEMPVFLANILAGLGCRVRDASCQQDEPGEAIRDGWQLKAFALKHCDFENVVMLDADQVPLKDPASLFEWPEYIETGAVFWPDIVDLSADNPVWSLLGLPARRLRSWESGQMCINKAAQWPAICVALEMNRRAETFYQMVYGDKDTFLLTWQLTESPHALVPHLPYQSERFLCQRDFDGAPLFQHRSSCKWSLNEENFRPDGFQLGDECEDFVEDLRRIWDGRIFYPPGRSAKAQRIEQELMTQRHFLYSEGNDATIDIELLPGCQIGGGRSFTMRNWYVECADGMPQLTLCDTRKPFSTMVSDNDVWTGKTLQLPVKHVCVKNASASAEPEAGPIGDGGLAGELIFSCLAHEQHSGEGLSKLEAAIELVWQIDPAVSRNVCLVADMISGPEPEFSRWLRNLAARLDDNADAPGEAVKRSPHEMLGNTKFYMPR